MTAMINWLFRLRNRHFFYLDFLIFLSTPALALVLRTDGLAITRYWQSLVVVTAVFLAIKVAVFLGLGLYNHYWRYASIDELANFALAGAGIAFFQAAAMFFWLRPTGWVDHSFPARSLFWTCCWPCRWRGSSATACVMWTTGSGAAGLRRRCERLWPGPATPG
ncbi:MAG: hypothetical protein IPH82_14585 [Chloroflexi bacterium]|nr:hypothetical protein [Chloroflexota bacterium]